MCFESQDTGARPARILGSQEFSDFKAQTQQNLKTLVSEESVLKFQIPSPFSTFCLTEMSSEITSLASFVYTQFFQGPTHPNLPGIVSIYTFCTGVIIMTAPFLSICVTHYTVT